MAGGHRCYIAEDLEMAVTRSDEEGQLVIWYVKTLVDW